MTAGLTRVLRPILRSAVREARRCAGAAARMPGLRSLFPYTPRHWAPSAQRWLADHPADGAMREIYPAATLELSPPRQVEPAAAWAFARERHPVPGASLIMLPGARYLCGRGFGLITRGNALLGDFSHDDGALAPPHSLMSYTGRSAPQILPGPLAVVHTPFARGNYAHWLLDCLPRLLLLKKHYPDYACLDHLVFEHNGLPFQTASLELAGLPQEKILNANAGLHVTAPTVVSPSFVQGVFHNQTWALELLREEYLPAAAKTAGRPRRFFVSRQQAQGGRITNFGQVEPLLAKYGIAIVDPAVMPWREQLRLFADAELIVAPHGAGLANLVFAPSGAKVIEMFSPAYFPTFFWELCGHRRLPYWAFFGEGVVGGPAASQSGSRNADISMAPAKLEKLLREVG